MWLTWKQPDPKMIVPENKMVVNDTNRNLLARLCAYFDRFRLVKLLSDDVLNVLIF